MREILFRAKRKDNGEWVYGDFIHSWHKLNTKSTPTIYNTLGKIDVDPSTVCQFTGLTDKDGTKIFESDIVTLFGEKYVVKWENNSCTYIIENSNTETEIIEFSSDYYEIIGNIIDSPELLE